MQKTLLVFNDKGRPFNVRLVEKGDRHGLNDCLTHDKDDPLVEFHDATYANQKAFGPLGQFVSSYYRSTFLGEDKFGGDPRNGLLLDGGSPDVWYVDDVATRMVARWLQHNRDKK